MYGNKYTDPIDGNTFRAFLPYGYNKIRTGTDRLGYEREILKFDICDMRHQNRSLKNNKKPIV